MDTNNLLVKKVDIKKMHMAEYNPRKDLQPGDIEYENLKQSILSFGYVEPIIWNETTGNIVGGHQRYKIMKELGCTQIDCVVISKTQQEEKALNIALNKIAGQWDMPLLSQLLHDLEISGFNLDITGFDSAEVKKIFSDQLITDIKEDENFCLDDALASSKRITQKGDMWLICNHRLLCGDATSADHVSELMQGENAQLAITDPPYNVNYDGKTKKRKAIENDNLPDKSFLQLLTKAFTNMESVMQAGAPYYLFHSTTESYNFINAINQSQLLFKQCLIWEKNQIALGRQDYQWRHEPIFYGWKSGTHKWYGGRKQSTILQFDKPSKSAEHPTMKPIKLVAQLMQNSSLIGDTVVDFFGGSGTTMMVAQQMQRVCHMLEIDPQYCDVILNRFAQFYPTEINNIYLIRNNEKLSYKSLVK